MAWHQPLELIISEKDPANKHKWRSIRKECCLVQELISSGATALGKANYRDGEGYYYSAFFNLSIGMERLAKLILAADHIIEKKGIAPSKKYIEKHGHNLIKLLDEVDKIAEKYKLKLKYEYERPQDSISIAIISCLDSFASSDKGRYDNFNNLDKEYSNDEFESIKKWWVDVAELILNNHYYNTGTDYLVKFYAILDSIPMDDNGFAFYIDETGEEMGTAEACFERDAKTELVQKVGQFHTLRIVRWMVIIFGVLCDRYGHSILYGHHKHLKNFLLTDKQLKDKLEYPPCLTPPTPTG